MMLGMAGVIAAPNVFGAMSVTLYDDTSMYSYGNGGEFRAVGNAGLNSVVNWSAYNTGSANNTAGTSDAYFQTFCTENAEEFTPSDSYPVTSIGNNALYNDTSHPVPITLGVAYLYSRFASGTLQNYDYTYGGSRSTSAGNLQNAIWSLLGEQSMSLLTGVAYNDLLAVTGSGPGDVFASQADWTAAANGAFGVGDMTLDNPGQAQDQLVMVVPETSTVIAGVLLLLPFGASTFRILRKNRAA